MLLWKITLLASRIPLRARALQQSLCIKDKNFSKQRFTIERKNSRDLAHHQACRERVFACRWSGLSNQYDGGDKLIQGLTLDALLLLFFFISRANLCQYREIEKCRRTCRLPKVKRLVKANESLLAKTPSLKRYQNLRLKGRKIKYSFHSDASPHALLPSTPHMQASVCPLCCRKIPHIFSLSTTQNIPYYHGINLFNFTTLIYTDVDYHYTGQLSVPFGTLINKVCG